MRTQEIRIEILRYQNMNLRAKIPNRHKAKNQDDIPSPPAQI